MATAARKAVGRARAGPVLRRLRAVFLGDQRTDLLTHLPKGSVGAEIGVWRGDFSARLLRVARPAQLHLVDPWNFEPGAAYEHAWYGGAVAKTQAEMDRVYESVLRRFADEMEAGTVHVHRGSSARIGVLFDNAYFDWVYIDGIICTRREERPEVFARQVNPRLTPVTTRRARMVGGRCDQAVDSLWPRTASRPPGPPFVLRRPRCLPRGGKPPGAERHDHCGGFTCCCLPAASGRVLDTRL